MGWWAALPLLGKIGVVSSVVQGVSAFMGAKEQKKVAAEAAKPQTTTQTRTPYAASYINQLIPYILSEQQRVYENRQEGYGFDAGPLDIAGILARGAAGMGGAGMALGQSEKPNASRLLSDSADDPLPMAAARAVPQRPPVDPALQANEIALAMARNEAPSIMDLIAYWESPKEGSSGRREVRN